MAINAPIERAREFVLARQGTTAAKERIPRTVQTAKMRMKGAQLARTVASLRPNSVKSYANARVPQPPIDQIQNARHRGCSPCR